MGHSKFSPTTVIFLIAILLKSVSAFDTILDHGSEMQTRRWKFEGSYGYANSSRDLEVVKLRQPKESGRLGASSVNDLDRRNGVWYVQHSESGNNTWKMSYSLSHLLFAQAWVTLIAHPGVKITFTTSGEKEVGKFWSDGKSWCDAVFSVGLHNTFTLKATTLKEGEYLILDKIVLGIMANISSLKNTTLKRNLNPCLSSPLMMDDTPPDMDPDKIQAPQSGNQLRRRQPGDDIPPDMATDDQITSSPSSNPAQKTPLGTRTYQTESGGAKCDCVCTCAKPSNISTSTTTMSTTSVF